MLPYLCFFIKVIWLVWKAQQVVAFRLHTCAFCLRPSIITEIFRTPVPKLNSTVKQREGSKFLHFLNKILYPGFQCPCLIEHFIEEAGSNLSIHETVLFHFCSAVEQPSELPPDLLDHWPVTLTSLWNAWQSTLWSCFHSLFPSTFPHLLLFLSPPLSSPSLLSPWAADTV